MMITKNRVSKQLHKPVIALILSSSIYAHAAIVSDDSERRIEVRSGSSADNSNAYIRPSSNNTGHRPGVTMLDGANAASSDSMQGLIAQKQQSFSLKSGVSIQENKRVNMNQRDFAHSRTGSNTRYNTANNTHNSAYSDFSSMDFNAWLNTNRYRATQVTEYRNYLSARVGSQNVPPLSQLLKTARSWHQCGYEPYELPPQELWANIVPTLRLYSELKNQGVLPASSEIRSVYRNPGLNRCAGGASSSKHMNASAIDIWVPEYQDDLWRLSTMQDGLCQFWQYQGEAHQFGLGLYATGAIHLDTDGYRKWGFHHASSSSSCRY